MRQVWCAAVCSAWLVLAGCGAKQGGGPAEPGASVAPGAPAVAPAGKDAPVVAEVTATSGGKPVVIGGAYAQTSPDWSKIEVLYSPITCDRYPMREVAFTFGGVKWAEGATTTFGPGAESAGHFFKGSNTMSARGLTGTLTVLKIEPGAVEVQVDLTHPDGHTLKGTIRMPVCPQF